MSTFWTFGRFVAQIQSSGLSEFLRQISGLLIGTCVAGALWVVLMLLVVQRAKERRRRERLGLEPLPGFWVGLARRARALLAPTENAADEEEHTSPEALPQPDVDALLGPDAPELPPQPEPEPAPAPITNTNAPPAATHQNTPTPSTEEPPMPTDPVRPQDTVEVLRVFRDISDGTLIVEISGQRFTSLAELRTAALERRFLRVLEEMQRFSKPPRQAPPSPAPTTPPPLSEADDELPSLALGSMFRQMRRAAMGQTPPPTEPPPQLSIADEIEALLQEKLTALPAFQKRTIHVTASPSGGVLIQVDERFYEGVDEIEEDDVRLLLESVVAEWQKRL